MVFAWFNTIFCKMCEREVLNISIALYCIHAPSKRGRYWEIHPRCPRDFPRPVEYGHSIRLGVNHYRYNHYQWPSLPYDTHYQWQSLPHDSHYHWQPLPATTTRFYLARKPLPATTTTWQQLPYDDHHHITKTTTFPLTICCLQMYENSKYLILG